MFNILGCIPVAVQRIIIRRGVVGHLPVENKFTIILSPNSFLPPLRPKISVLNRLLLLIIKQILKGLLFFFYKYGADFLNLLRGNCYVTIFIYFNILRHPWIMFNLYIPNLPTQNFFCLTWKRGNFNFTSALRKF